MKSSIEAIRSPLEEKKQKGERKREKRLSIHFPLAPRSLEESKIGI